MSALRFGVGLWCVGFTADRFVPGGYRPESDFEQQVDMVSKLDQAEAVELHYPADFEGRSPAEIRKVLDDHGLIPSALNNNALFGDPIYKYGAFTNTDEKLRRGAIDSAKKGVDAAKAIGCPLLNLWPGQDGFDYCFQTDYTFLWESTMEACAEICEYAGPDLNVAYEYKLKEPRKFSVVGTAGKALALCNAVGADNLGVTLDFGHSLLGRENPAEATCTLVHAGRMFNVHFNDNYGEWDDDLIAGAVNLWTTLEYLWYLKKLRYEGFVTLDMFPFREGPVEATRLALQMARTLERIADRLDADTIADCQRRKDVTGVFEYLRSQTLRS